MSADRREPLERFPSRTHAELAAATLEGEGIHAWVEADDVGGQYPGIERRKGARLYVEEADRARARELLDAPAVKAADVPVGEAITAQAEAAVTGGGSNRGVFLAIGAVLVALAFYALTRS